MMNLSVFLSIKGLVFYGDAPVHKQTREIDEMEKLIIQIHNGTCTGSTVRRLYRLSRDLSSGFAASDIMWRKYAKIAVDAIFRRLDPNASVFFINGRIFLCKRIVLYFLSKL
jgi:hypothetical protein